MTYYGFMTMADGQTRVWVHDSKSGARRLYKMGERLADGRMTVRAADARRLEITDAGQVRVSLPFATPRAFEEGHYVP